MKPFAGPSTVRIRRLARSSANRFTAALTVLLLSLSALTGVAQQQQQGVCARVKIEILQELTLERIGFLATLEVTNNDGEEPITDFFADLTFEDPARSTNNIAYDASRLFFVRAPELENINGIEGNGVIGPTKKAVVRWFIIPKIAAGGTNAVGIFYSVGARLSGKLRGVDIPEDVLLVNPDTIQVRPEPQLEITYFQPRDVQGDDPFTEQAESPIPFTLGVLVKNAGYGTARKLKIDSQQPKIVENVNGVLLIARLLGARVQDSPLESSSLLVNLGDILPGQARKGAWDMITSLSGEFVEVKASYTHASDLGGEETSVIKSLEAHFIAREVLSDQPGRDPILDFLADTDRDIDMIPDTLYESEGNVIPVNHLTAADISGGGASYRVSLTADKAGWGYVRLADPAQNRLRIASVVRSDGKVLNPRNYWTNTRYAKLGNIRSDYLNLFDLVDLRAYEYTVTYQTSTEDNTPPVTTLHFAGPSTFANGRYFITPETQMYFIAEDENPVSIVYSLTNSAFLPAIPFQVRGPGEYGLQYYATDSAGNRETNRSAVLVVAGDAPSFVSADIPAQPIFISGEALSVRPNAAELRFQAQPNPTRLDADVDIFRGAVGWATVAGLPSSPTRGSGASLVVGGDHVDYYRVQVDSGVWSSETPVATPIQLVDLGPGQHTVAVQGRSEHGDYLAESNTVVVSWVVDPTAPATQISGTPPTPARGNTARLTVGGEGVTGYRWTINDGFYRAETDVTAPIVLSSLTGAQQVVSVIGRINGAMQATNNATTVTWQTDPMYGSDLSALTLVRSASLTNVGAGLNRYAWDGRNGSGAVMPPGWYTLRIVLKDELGRSSFATRLVEIGDLAGAQAILADLDRGAKNPYARGRWAVWQDQKDGRWKIYGQDLSAVTPSITAISTGQSNQENPKTDGRYMVWQGRQPNGNWDVMMADSTLLGVAAPLTLTSDQDEVNPTVEWPWVVYQTRAAGNTNAPWQIRALNLVTRQTSEVWPGAQDQLDPDVQGGRVVWQDHRDVGFGEIYLKDLETGLQRRLTTNGFGQYRPVIYDQWVLWQDNRNGQVDLYGFDLLRDAEIRVTHTTENEARPFLDGPWAVCEEDSLGVLSSNLRLIHLPSLRTVPLTRSSSVKRRPALAAGRVIWEDLDNNVRRVISAGVPDVQAVFQNQNAVAVTPAMAGFQQNAFNLLKVWQAEAGVEEITSYAALVPTVVSQTARYVNGQPIGSNFVLTPGSFLWVKFNQNRVVDLGSNSSGPLNLAVGVNVVSYTKFPSSYSAFQLLRQLGLNNARAVRMLDAESGRWLVAQVSGNKLIGHDFRVPTVAVLMIDLAAPVNQWKPE